jgi:hypothetical protein
LRALTGDAPVGCDSSRDAAVMIGLAASAVIACVVFL